MDDLTRLKTAMELITVGLCEKDRKKIRGEYFYSKRLIHGINIFQYLNYKYNQENFDFNQLHEQKFITDYAMKPVRDWFEGWKNTENLKLEEQEFYYMEELVGDISSCMFYVNDCCEDYVQYYVEKDIIAGIEQRAVYDCLKLLEQDDYVYLRKYFIQHPIAEQGDLRRLKLRYSQNEMALQAIENAYEEIREDCYVCPKCGWTLKKEKSKMICQSRYCTESKPSQEELNLAKIERNDGKFRLKRGVMMYICTPGKLELEILKGCEKYKIKSSLWPELDKYDIEIVFDNGEIWAVDAKQVRNPYFLRSNIRNEGGFPEGNYQKALYVIPDEFKNEQTDYIKIIEAELKKIGKNNIYCVTLGELKETLKLKGNNGTKKEAANAADKKEI